MSTIGILNPRPALKLEYKLTAMDSLEQLIITGDEKGYLYRYIATPDEVTMISPNNQMNKQAAKSRIEQIKFIPGLNQQLIVLAEYLYFVNAVNGLAIELISKEKIKSFTVNEYPRGSPEFICITKNKEGLIYVYKEGRWEMQAQKFLLGAMPSSTIFVGSQFYLTYPDKPYYVINLDEKSMQQKPLNIIAQQGFMKLTDNDELFVLTVNQLGLFIGRDGQPKQKSAINLQNKNQILSITTYKGYLLVLFETVIQIYNISDASKLPEITITNSQFKCLTSTCNKYLFYASGIEIVYLKQTSPEQQIKELLQKARVDEAIKVFSQQIAPFDQNKENKFEQLNLDCAWSLIRNLQFSEATKYLLRVNFDPRDLICLFPLYIISVKKLQSINDNPSKIQMPLFIQSFIQDQPSQTKDKNESGRKMQEFNTQSRDFIINALEKKRASYTSGQSTSFKDKLHPLVSPLSINNNQWQALSIEEMLELLDYALIQAYCDQQQYEGLSKLFKGNTIYCASMYKQLKDKISKINNEAQWNITPRFEESFSQIDSALDTWKLISETQNDKISNEACSECIRILQQYPERNRIFKHLGWVLKKSSQIGSKLFESLDENLVTPVQMFKFFEDMDIDQNNRRILREKYLEVLVITRGIDDEVLHTQLAKSYIDSIFQIFPSNTPFENLDFNNPQLQPIYLKFKQFINNPKSKYNSSSLLDYRVKDSWMLPEIISLYGREKRHDEALTKLIELGEFDWAEKYCCEHTDMLLTKLFRKYVDMFNRLQNDPKAQESMKRVNLETINNFLKKYATHSQLNPLEVIEIIPDKWMLSLNDGKDGLNCFLNSVISHTLHQRRATGAAKHLQEMDLLNVECQYANAKKAYVRITQEKKCAVCTRSIGDKVFVVYPNAVVAHHTCIKNNAICPKTEKDFEKYFKF